VRNYFGRFIVEAERGDILSAARSYGVEGQVRELLSVRKELNRSGLEPNECLAGSRVVKRLRDLGIDESKFADFIHSAYTDAVEQGLKPEEFVDSCTELRRLRRLTGKGYSVILEDFKTKHEVNEKLNVENRELEKERRGLKNLLLQEMREKNTTLETLKWFDETRKALKNNGVEVEELEKLSTLLVNVSEKSYDTKDVINFYSVTRDLEDQKSLLETSICSLTSEEASLKERSEALTEIISGNQDIVDSISEIKSMNLSVENINEILEKVTEVSSLHGMNRKEALDKFISEIDLQYEAKLGYENEVNRLQSRTSRLNDKISDLEAHLQRLENVFAEKKEIYDRLTSLNDRGVKNEDLVHWDEIIRETEIDLVTIRRDIAQLGGLRQWFDRKFQEKSKIESEIKSLNREIETFRNQKENYEAELTSLTTGVLAEAKRELERLPGIIDDLRIDLLNPQTGLKGKSLKMVDETLSIMGDLLIQRERLWTGILRNAEEKISKMDDLLNDLLKTACEGGRDVGQIKALEALHRLQAGEDLGYLEGLRTTAAILPHIKNWFEKNGLTDCVRPNQIILSNIEKELRNPGKIRIGSIS
jgi:chaperonin cofactor prefoldin